MYNIQVVFTTCTSFHFHGLQYKEIGNIDFTESIINFQPSHGVKAVKICILCEDFRKSSHSLYGFEKYCGPNVFGNIEPMSGIIFIPIADSTKAVKSGDLNVSSHLNIVY